MSSGVAPAGGEQPGDERLADLAGAEYRDPSLVHSHAPILEAVAASTRRGSCAAGSGGRDPGSAPGISPRDQPSMSICPASPCHSSYAREQRRGLGGLDPAALERGDELDQPEVADEPVVVAAEPLERDHADRPGADAALAAEPLQDDAGVVRRAAARDRASARAARASSRVRSRGRPRGARPG